MLAREAVLWLALALCVFVFISFFGIGGYIGSILSDICFGIFGLSAYLFPLLLFLAVAFLISNRGSRLAGMKFTACVVLYLCICCFAALMEGEFEGTYNVARLYAACASMKRGGGVIGGTVCYFLIPALGTIGTGVLLGVFSLIALVLITQKSLMRGVKNQGSRVYQSARESSERRKEERRSRDEWLRIEERNDTPAESEQQIHSQSQVMDSNDTGFSPQVERVPLFGNRRKKQVSIQGLSASAEPESSFQTCDMGYVDTGDTVGNLSQPFVTEYTAKSKPSKRNKTADAKERELDVSVMFAPQTEPRRHHRHVNGVTMDTKISGDVTRVGTEIHEILPAASDPNETDAEEAGTVFSDTESGYIDLERMDLTLSKETGKNPEPLQADSSVSEKQVYSDLIPLHIEGMDEEEDRISAETPEEEVSSVHGSRSAEKHSEDERLVASEYENVQENNGRDVRVDSEKNPDKDIVSKAHQKVEGDTSQDVEKDAQQTVSSGGKIKRNPRSSEQEIAEGIASVEAEAAAAEAAVAARPEYVFPPLDLLKKSSSKSRKGQGQEIRQTAAKLQQTLNSFGVHVTVTNVSCGPSVTRYELLPEQGVKVSRIVSLSDDIKLNLAAADIRIEAPIPGKSAVGIEVPNAENSTVPLRELLESEEFQNHPSKLAFATGKDIGGKVVVSDIAKMPHLLIAGATGSGKSVCINTLIMSILYKAKPEEVKLIMIDPKVVELSVYNGIPHLMIPVVTDPKKAAGALNWGVAEMTDRYAKFAEVGVRDLKGYNQKIEALKDIDDPNKPQKLPQIVIIVDELADLMMVAPGEVEDSICRLAQLARAAGIHLIIATQRPSVNVITGLIKANMPSRIAFSVSSGVDSRTIIDMYGAEKLLGKGDMLFYPQGYQKPARVQGAFVSDEEVSDVVDFLKNSNSSAVYSQEMEQQIAKVQQAAAATRAAEDTDELFTDAGKFIIEKDKASIGMLQRVFKIGFNRAARIMDQLSDAGVVGPEEGTKPRKILMSMEQFENYLEQN
ncbi:MAG: DNA translocase FtsK [Clostridiales bacterium]|nr:DNA translocase FtsK [Clostridiales bacterium]